MTALPAVLSSAFALPFEQHVASPITIYVAYPPGGGYDAYARLLQRHLGRYLPGNGRVVVSNMPGAQGLMCANFMYKSAPKDGSAIAILYQGVAEEQVLATPGVEYDVSRFNWIGRLDSTDELLFVWHSVPVDAVDGLKRRETIFASDGARIDRILRIVQIAEGARIKIVHGYLGTRDMNLALERGEIEGALNSLNTLRSVKPDWLRAAKIKTLLQVAPKRSHALPDVPVLAELAAGAQERELADFAIRSGVIGHSFLAPPGVPPERIAMLREAFDRAVKDPQFLEDARRAGMEINPLGGAPLQRFAERSVSLDPLTLAHIRTALVP